MFIGNWQQLGSELLLFFLGGCSEFGLPIRHVHTSVRQYSTFVDNVYPFAGLYSLIRVYTYMY